MDELNETLLAKAVEAKPLRTGRRRADTTVAPADVAHPTGSSLLAKAVGRTAVAEERIQAAGGPTRPRVRHRGRHGANFLPAAIPRHTTARR